MSKIIYLIEQPLDVRNYNRFGIQTWIDRGWDIEIWDLTPLLHPRVWQNYFETGHEIKKIEGYFPIVSKSELYCSYARAKKIDYYIDLIGVNNVSLRVKLHLKRIGAKGIIISNGSIPEPEYNGAIYIASILRKIRKNPINSLKWLVEALLRKLATFYIRPWLGVISGEKSIQFMSYANELIMAHNLDYDLYLKNKQTIDVTRGKYAVFIDNDYCFHSDFIYLSIAAPATPEKYFSVVCNALHRVSDALELELYIAAHPRSSYQHRGKDYYEGIPIIYGSTVDLIRDCTIVVGHNSAAVQFAVLFEKPIVFVTTDELNSSLYTSASIACFASELGKSVVNIDRDLDKVVWSNELIIDHKKYSDYRHKYIKIEGSLEKPFWDIVIDHLEKYT